MNYNSLRDVLTDCWVKSLWKFCWSSDIQVHLKIPHLKKLRQQDKFLMDAFIATNPSQKELFRLNMCRIHLQAITLADITTCDGRKIAHEAFHGTGSNSLRSHLEWPRSPSKLPTTFWDTWRSTLRKCFLTPFSASLQLRNTLGTWDLQIENDWMWFYSERTTEYTTKKA